MLFSKKLLIIALLFFLISFLPSSLGEVVYATLAEAFLQVSVFVGLTLGIFYSLEKVFKTDTSTLFVRYEKWQVPIASFLGALPGCGGAIVVITQYTTGKLRFGAMVAVLIATMGDAAFVLIAKEPLTGLLIIVLSFCVGVLSGHLVDWVHGPHFLRPKKKLTPFDPSYLEKNLPFESSMKVFEGIWVAIFLFCLPLSIMGAAQIDPNILFGFLKGYQPPAILGMVGAILSLFVWSTHPSLSGLIGIPHSTSGSIYQKVVVETSFVTVWVVIGFLFYEVTMYLANINLQSIFQTWRPLTPLAGILIGFIPGCGPQVVVTTLYINGIIPLSAQIGNAISNDGDALFPAIALTPKAALYATVYSAIPAIIVAYAWFFLFEL